MSEERNAECAFCHRPMISRSCVLFGRRIWSTLHNECVQPWTERFGGEAGHLEGDVAKVSGAPKQSGPDWDE